MVVLVINCGSSSLKYQLFDMAREVSLADGLAERVSIAGGAQALLKHRGAGKPAFFHETPMPNHTVAMGYVLDALTHPDHGVIASLTDIAAIGHRVVHGGEKFAASVLIDQGVIAAVEEFSELAPLHNPANLQGIRACSESLPGVPQVAVFDTAFHQTMPPRAYLYGLPYSLYQERRIRRYGFHGTSHRYVTLQAGQWLERERGIPPAEQCVVTCHLGNGCSMAAVKGGQGVDTTMGLTPLEGLLMGTRCGDLDPAIVGFLMDTLGLSAADADRILNKESGLLGISGVGSDMRDVKAAAFGDPPNPRARAAIEVFCYRVRKYVGAYAAALGDLHALVFTAGIGENDPLVRRMATEGLGVLGLWVDPERNEHLSREAPVTNIATDASRAAVLVIPTNEELMIARDTAQIIGNQGSGAMSQ